MSHGFETEEVLLQWAIKHVALGARTAAIKLVSEIFLNDPAFTVPTGVCIVDQLVARGLGFAEIPSQGHWGEAGGKTAYLPATAVLPLLHARMGGARKIWVPSGSLGLLGASAIQPSGPAKPPAMRMHLTNSRERLRQVHEAAEAQA